MSTCGDDVQDTLTIVDTKDPAEIINEHVTNDQIEDAVDSSTAVQALEEISSVVSPDVDPVYTTMSAVYQDTKNLIQVNSDQLEVSKNIVQVNSADFQSVLNGAHGNDVLMVVSNPNGNGEKPILAYEVAQEAMLAYANQQFANVGIVGIAREGDTIVQHSGNVAQEINDADEPVAKQVKIELEIPPEELILRMSEVMHKTTS